MDNTTMDSKLMEMISAEGAWSNRRTILLLVFAGILVSYFYNSSTPSVKAPVVGPRSVFEPNWLVRMRFKNGRTAREIIYGGYSQFKESMFTFLRFDGDILVLSHKYLKQLGNLTEDVSSSSEGQMRSMGGSWTAAEILCHGDLHFRVVQRRLTPNITATIPMMKDELEYTFGVEIPGCEDKWVDVNLFDMFANIIARVTGRVFVGDVACRNKDWLSASVNYDINVGTSIGLLRMFPPLLHPLIGWLMPSYWRARKNIATVQSILGPIVRERRAKKAQEGSDYTMPQDVLQWMMDEADTPVDEEPDSLAARQLLIGLAALHTTSMTTTHAIYDLCAQPEYFQSLREEMLTVLREDGGFQKQTLNKLRHLDSFIKESQRVNPPSLIGLNRYLRTSFTLSDGTVLPAGTRFCMAADPILNDPDCLPGGGVPTAFDGFRYSRLREDDTNPDDINRYQFASVDSTSFHFGGGRFACPGRFYASAVIKLIFVHLLLRYDFKFPDGFGRPKNLTMDENIFPDPKGRVVMRRREKVEADVENLLTAAADLEQWV